MADVIRLGSFMKRMGEPSHAFLALRPIMCYAVFLLDGFALVVVPAIPCHSSVGEAGPQALETG